MASSSSPPPAAASLASSSFPTAGLLPKAETQADAFLRANPKADGRGITVAIFDTGCDASASGMQRTTDGQVKFVDFIDATGSGDVSTSTRIEAAPGADGLTRFKSPLSQRDLVLPAVTNPRGVWQVGVKRAYELYPAPLVTRMKAERRKQFDESQRALEQDLQGRLSRWDADSKAAEGAKSSDLETPTAPVSFPSTYTAKDKVDLETRLAEIKAFSARFDDPGPVMDVVCWCTQAKPEVDPSTGRTRGWIVLVDSTGTGNFVSAPAAKPLAPWNEGHEFAYFSGLDLMSYTVNVYEEGRVVALVTTAGSHGTHVAGIVGANEAKETLSDSADGVEAHSGIAPGARMVSIRIGDSRLGSMETGVGLVRGLIEAIRLRVDVINMSYGEASSLPNSGRISELIRSAVFDHGIVFVSSAGNNGPALSTSGSPGATDVGVISVGAYVSPAMAAACYSARRIPLESQYSWSSRGPTTDGAAGVTVSACGGAITSVCSWQLQKSQLMNGTSMSSPACAGGVALLLSGLKARGIKWTPQRIKHALECTARPIDRIEPLALGSGLLQIQAAFEHLTTFAYLAELDLLYKLTIPSTGARGIYLRDAPDADAPYEANVQIEAVFPEQRIDQELGGRGEERKDAAEAPPGVANPLNFALNAARVAFQQQIALVSTVDWLHHADHVLLTHGGRTVSVVVHGEKLQPGVHFTELYGFDATVPQEQWRSRGPLFKLPVTVIKTEKPAVAAPVATSSKALKLLGASAESAGAANPSGASFRFDNLPCDSGIVHRRFVTVPEGASFVDFTVRAHGFAPGESGEKPDPSRSFMFHALYLRPEESYDKHELSSFFALADSTADAGSKKELRMDVRPGATLEVCLSQYWSSVGKCTAEVDVQFQGLAVDSGDEVVLDASTPFAPVSFRAVLRNTKLNPSASVKTWCSVLKPAPAAITQLSRERDFITRDSRQISALQLTYSFELKEDASNVRVRAPALNERLYESAYESQLTQIYDQNKRFMFATDAFETGKSLKAGKYFARIQVRHDDASMLERLKDMPAVLELALAKAIDLPIYASYTTAIAGGAKFGAAKSIKAGKASLLYVGSPEAKAFPSFAKAGDWGEGQLVIVKAEGGATEKPGALKLKLYAPSGAASTAPAAAASASTSAKKAEPAKVAVADAASSPKPAEPEADPAFPKLEAKEEKKDASSASAAPAPSSSPAPAASSSPAAAAAVTVPSSLAIELRDLVVEHLGKLASTGNEAKKLEAVEKVLPPLIAASPTHLPLLWLDLRFTHELNAAKPRSERRNAAVVAKARELLTKQIDQTQLLAHFGRLIDKDDAAGAALRKEKEAVRATLTKSLAIILDVAMDEARGFKSSARLIAFEWNATPNEAEHDEIPIDGVTTSFAAAIAVFNSTLAELASWTDLSKDAKTYGAYQAFQLKSGRQLGILMRDLSASIAAATDGATQKQLLQDRLDLLAFLNADSQAKLYTRLIQFERDSMVLRFPNDFGPA